MNIIFDLDGTLSCCKQRIYHLFDELVEESKISFESYWDLKYACLTNEDILNKYFCYSQDKIDFFLKRWQSLIETKRFIDNDFLFDGVKNHLEKLSDQADLYICTARQFEQVALQQIENFGILSLFKKVLVTEQKKTKFDLIVENIGDISHSDWIIGDTGHDIQTGKRLGIQTCAVLSGIMNAYNLKRYEPNKLIPSIVDFNIE